MFSEFESSLPVVGCIDAIVVDDRVHPFDLEERL
jgi:hypothetical protein